MSVTEKQKEYAKKYLAKFAEIRIRIEPELKQEFEKLAAKKGKSVNQYLKDFIQSEVESAALD